MIGINSLIKPPEMPAPRPKNCRENRYTTKTCQDCVEAFVGSIPEESREATRKMLEKGMKLGKSFAKTYGIDPEAFQVALEGRLDVNG